MALRWLFMWLLLSAILSGCGPICEGTTGSCLDLRVERSGSAITGEALTAWILGTDLTGAPIRVAGTIPNSVSLPTNVALIPPPYLQEVSRVSAQILGDSQALALTGRTSLRWPTGEHIQASVSLAVPSLAFTKTADLRVGEAPSSVALFDANQDGKLDLAVASSVPSFGSRMDMVSLLLGQGNGSFGSPQKLAELPVLTVISNLIAADLNGDGLTDLAYADWSFANVYLLLGQRDGTFQPVKQLRSSVANPGTLVARDLDGDKQIDLIIESYTGSIGVMWNQGDANFSTSTNLITGSEVNVPDPDSFAVEDLNSDGLPDVVSRAASNDSLLIWMNKGGRTFGSPATVKVDFFRSDITLSFTVQDFDGDTVPDLLVGGKSFAKGDWVGFLKGDGRGQFAEANQRRVSYDPQWLSGPDLNDDLIPDLCAVGSSAAASDAPLHLALGNGSGGFQENSCGSCQLPAGTTSVTANDLDGDQKLDLLILTARTGSSTGSVIVLRNVSP